MSSSYVRSQIKTYLGTNFPTENVVDLTAQYRSIGDILSDEGITHNDNWLGIQFSSSEERVISIPADNSQGLYREVGIIFLHIVEPVRKDVVDLLLARSEDLRDSFRGKRIGDVVVEEVSPPSFENGTTIQFEGGYTSASVIVSYYRDIKL